MLINSLRQGTTKKMSTTFRSTLPLPSTQQVLDWSEQEVSSFLKQRNFHEKSVQGMFSKQCKIIVKVLLENYVNGEVLLNCKKDDFIQMGVSLAQSILLHSLVRSITKEASVNTSMTHKTKETEPSKNQTDQFSVVPISQQLVLIPTQTPKKTEFELRYGVSKYDCHILGRGGFGAVYEVQYKNKKVAVKVICPSDDFSVNSALKEAIQQIKMSHPNIVNVTAVFLSSENGKTELCIEMEHIPCGSLRNLVASNVSEKMIWSILQQIISALNYLYSSLNMVHRDIKLDNILVKSVENDEIVVCLADFGLAKTIEDGESKQMFTFCGTKAYMAPEILRCMFGGDVSIIQPYSEKTDLYSLGVTLFLLLTGKPIFDPNVKERNKMLQSVKGKYSAKLIDVVQRMMEEDYKNRPSLADLISIVSSPVKTTQPVYSPKVTSQLPNVANVAPPPTFSFSTEPVSITRIKEQYETLPIITIRSTSNLLKLAYYYRVNNQLDKAFDIYFEALKHLDDSELYACFTSLHKSGYENESKYQEVFNYCMDHSKGNSVAQFYVGVFYCENIGLERNYYKGIEWLEKSEESGNSYASYYLGLMYFFGKGVEKNIHASNAYFKKGILFSAFGVSYLYGDGLLQNTAIALHYFDQVKDQASIAWYNIGKMFENGQSFQKSSEKARQCFEKSFHGGYEPAMSELGRSFEKEGRLSEAKECYEFGAIMGDVHAMFVLADMYASGKGEAVNATQAMAYYQKAAKFGSKPALKELARLYYYGVGIPKNYKEAFHYYSRAVEEGCQECHFDVGYQLENGEGVDKDVVKAVEHYEKLYNFSCMVRLHNIYNEGLGQVVKNERKSFTALQDMVKMGGRQACHALSSMYSSLGNHEKGNQVAKQGMSLGNEHCMLKFGVNLVIGNGIQQDPNRGFKLITQVATQTTDNSLKTNSYQILAEMYKNGVGVVKDLNKAMEYEELSHQFPTSK